MKVLPIEPAPRARTGAEELSVPEVGSPLASGAPPHPWEACDGTTCHCHNGICPDCGCLR